MEHLTFKSKQAHFKIVVLCQEVIKEFSNFLGIHVTEVGAFFLKYTIVTLPLPGSVLVYTTSKPPSPIKRRKKEKKPYMCYIPQKIASIIEDRVVSCSPSAKSSPLLAQGLRIVF